MTLTDALKKARSLLRSRDLLSTWEINFLKSCLKYSHKLTDKQIVRLRQVIGKYHKTANNRQPAPLRRTDAIKIRFTADEIIRGKALRYFPLKKRRT